MWSSPDRHGRERLWRRPGVHQRAWHSKRAGEWPDVGTGRDCEWPGCGGGQKQPAGLAGGQRLRKVKIEGARATLRDWRTHRRRKIDSGALRNRFPKPRDTNGGQPSPWYVHGEVKLPVSSVRTTIAARSAPENRKAHPRC